jgi:hypothetical protein
MCIRLLVSMTACNLLANGPEAPVADRVDLEGLGVSILGTQFASCSVSACHVYSLRVA